MLGEMFPCHYQSQTVLFLHPFAFFSGRLKKRVYFLLFCYDIEQAKEFKEVVKY